MHPFKEFQKRRSGRMGQRFHTVIVHNGDERPTYDGETMFCGWADTNAGKTLKLWLDEEATTHPFHGFRRRKGDVIGSLFQAVFTLLNCDGQPIDTDTERAIADERKQRRFSSHVHLMITSARFVQFMTERSKKTATLQKKGFGWDSINPDTGEMMTKAYVKAFLGLESLADLDRDAKKAERFHNVFRRPFARWNGDDS